MSKICTRCNKVTPRISASKYEEGKFCPSCYATIFNAHKNDVPVPHVRPRKGEDINIGICQACDKAGVHIYNLADGTRVCAECFEAAGIAEEDGVQIVPPESSPLGAVWVKILCRDMAALNKLLSIHGEAIVTPYIGEVNQ
jgi:phage FluMu protein Com